jgi:hypothetical protein
VISSLNVFSQIDAKSKTVLNDFILGYDNTKSLIKKGVDINPVNITEYEDVLIIRLN